MIGRSRTYLREAIRSIGPLHAAINAGREREAMLWVATRGQLCWMASLALAARKASS
jgi:hypothetical protein